MKTKLISSKEYYSSSHLTPFSVQEVIKQRVNKESFVLSNLEYMPAIPHVDIPKFDWSVAVKRAFSYDITKAIRNCYP